MVFATDMAVKECLIICALNVHINNFKKLLIFFKLGNNLLFFLANVGL